MPDCSYTHRFHRFPSGEEQRECVLEADHTVHHVVIDPNTGRPMEVLPQQSARTNKLSDYIAAHFPSKESNGPSA